MQNARKYDERITIGVVPNRDDLEQLKQLGYKTLIDLRDDDEYFGGTVQQEAEELGFKYWSIPINRNRIDLESVQRFYRVVYERGSAPIYTFSRVGKKPLAFLLVFEAVAREEPIYRVFRRASEFGVDLGGDMCIQEFIVGLVNSGVVLPLVEMVRELRPDLMEAQEQEQAIARQNGLGDDPVQAALVEASGHWAREHDRQALRAILRDLLRKLEG